MQVFVCFLDILSFYSNETMREMEMQQKSPAWLDMTSWYVMGVLTPKGHCNVSIYALFFIWF